MSCCALIEFNFLVGCMPCRTGCPGWFGRRKRGVVSGRRLIGVLDGAQPRGDAGFAGGDGLAVTTAVGPVGPVATGPLDFAGVSLALVGVRGDGEHGDAGRGGVQDEGDCAGFGVVAGQGGDPGAIGLGPGQLGYRAAVPGPGVGGGEQGAARSIWSQAAPKFSPTGPMRVPRLTQ